MMNRSARRQILRNCLKKYFFIFPFSSQLCESSQRRQIKLKEMMDIDYGKNFFNGDSMAHKCNQCEYTSFRVGNLREHLLTHSGEKANKCKQCDYASSRAGHLKRHLKTHSGEKSNKCNQCDYASSMAGNLRRHLKTHSGEKSNRCNQCQYSYSRADNLRTHLRTHLRTPTEEK